MARRLRRWNGTTWITIVDFDTMDAAVTGLDTRIDTLESTDTDYDTRLDALEATDAALGATYVNVTGDTMTGALVVQNNLRVEGASSGLMIRDRDGSGDWQLYHNAGTFGIHNGTDRLTIDSIGDVYLANRLVMANGWAIHAKDSGGNIRTMLQRFSDNKTYLDGGTAGSVFRTNDGSFTSFILAADGTLQMDFDGTLSAPAISRTDDTNTGITFGNSGVMNIVSDGTIALHTSAGAGGYNAGKTTAVTQTVRDSGFGLMAAPTSTITVKDNVTDLDGDLALDVLQQLRPVKFTYKPFPDDTPEVAALRPLAPQIGFVAEEMAAVETPFDLAEYTPTVETLDDLDAWAPTYWKEPHVLTLCVAAIQRLEERIAELENP